MKFWTISGLLSPCLMNRTHIQFAISFVAHTWICIRVSPSFVPGGLLNFTTSTGLTENSTPVIGFQGTGNDNQKWIIKKETSGTGFWK